jgi:hypothetical protein
MSAITGVSRRLFPLLSMSLVATALALAPRPSAASQAEILELTQTSC